MSGAIDFTIDLSELEEIARKYAGASSVIDDELFKAMDRTVMAMEARAKKPQRNREVGYVPVAKGDLYRSITHSTKRIGGDIRGEFGTNKTYAKYVESGRRPGSFPPIAAIESWVMTKNRYSKIFNISSDNTAAVHRVAYAVAWGIYKRGIEPNPFMEQTAAELWPAAVREFKLVPRKVIAKVTAP